MQLAEIVAHQLQVSHRVIDARVGMYSQALRFQRLAQGNRFTSVADIRGESKLTLVRVEKKARGAKLSTSWLMMPYSRAFTAQAESLLQRRDE
ncbi:hypothetical protein ACNKHT_05570 [Shigella flexneri]